MKRSDTSGGAELKGARSRKKRELQALRVPTEAELFEAVDDLGLADGPAAVLDFVIRDALADLRTYQSSRTRKIGHDERFADPIKEIYKLLSKLVSFLEANPSVLKDILPATAGEKLGELFSFTGIGRALERNAFPDDGKPLRSYLRRNALPFDIASVEHFYAQTREDFGLVQGDRLFLYALRVVPSRSKLVCGEIRKQRGPPGKSRTPVFDRASCEGGA